MLGAYCLCYNFRVKALKKDTPPKATRTLTAHDSAKSSRKVAPSLFHPSNIQLSSTPKVSRTRSIGSHSDTGDTLDLTKVLQDAYDSPVRGHRIRVSLSERRRQQRELQKQQTNRASTDGSIKSIKSSDSCDSCPLVDNPDNKRPDGNTSHSSSGSGRQMSMETHQLASVWKDRRMLQGKSVIARHVTEDGGSPGRSSGSTQCGFLRHASRHVKAHSGTDRADGLHSMLNLDHLTVPTSLFSSPRSNNEIFEEHKEIMSHLDSVIGRARAVMTKAANRKRLDFGPGTQSDTPTDGSTSKTDPDVLPSADEILTDAPKSTSVRRKLAWDNDHQASYLNDSQPQNGVGMSALTLHTGLSTGGATIAADTTELDVDDGTLPAWATREAVMVKQSSEDVSLISNTSDLSFGNSDTVIKSLDYLNKCNLLGDPRTNRCSKQQTWPQPSSGQLANGMEDGEKKESGKDSCNSGEVEKSSCMSGEQQLTDRQADNCANHDNKEKAESPERKCATTEFTSHSALPLGDDFLKVLETVKSVQDQLEEERIGHTQAAQNAYYGHFPDLLHMSANVRRGLNMSAGGFTTQLSTEKIIQKLDAAIEKIASETNVIKQLSPRKKSDDQLDGSDNEQDRTGSEQNSAVKSQDDVTAPTGKQQLAEALSCDKVKRDVNENVHCCTMSSFESLKSNYDGKSYVLSRALSVGRNILPGMPEDTITRSRNKSSEGATVPTHSPKRHNLMATHEGSAFSKVSDKSVKLQPDGSDSTESHQNDSLQSHKALQNISVGSYKNGLKYAMSPLRIEKLSGTIFSPIQCFPVTPRDNHVITVPSIVTKTLLKGHSEPVVGDAWPYDQCTQLSSGGSEGTQSTGDIVTMTVVTRSMLHDFVLPDTDLTGDRQNEKDSVSPKTPGTSVGDGDAVTHDVNKQDVDGDEHGQGVTKASVDTAACVDSTACVDSNDDIAAASGSSPTNLTGDSCDQSPCNAVTTSVQSPGSQQSSSGRDSAQSNKETALQRAQ